MQFNKDANLYKSTAYEGNVVYWFTANVSKF